MNSRLPLVAVLIFVAVGAGAAVFLWSNRRSKSAEAPPILLPLPHFVLQAQDGRSYGSDQLLGRAWIANFIFTRCKATCPQQTSKLAEIQRDLKSEPQWKDVRLISITVDPEFDRPEVLAEYASDAGADSESWKFLTGTREDIWQLSKDGFKLPVAEEPDANSPVTHSPKFVLVDPQGTVRGFYDSDSSTSIEKLKRDVVQVIEERYLHDPEILDPPWLPERRQRQLDGRGKHRPFHDFTFRDDQLVSGIDFRNRIVDDAGRSWKPAHYDHGNGVAVADVDGDGLLDVYLVSQVARNGLWKNLGSGRFEEITDKAGVALADRVGVSASFADIDNDGDPDLYVTNVRHGNVMFRNEGDGSFTDISAEAGLGYKGHSSSAVFFDYDNDGLLDLFLVNVGVYTTDEERTVVGDRTTGGDTNTYQYFSANPDAFAAHLKPGRSERSILFRNQGGNHFRDVSEQAKLEDLSWSGDASPIDVNEDGFQDLYVLNMQGHDEYYENVNGEYFIRKSRERFPETPWGAMGIKVFDFDNDSKLDIFLTDMHTDMAKELGPFEEKTKIPAGAMEPSLLKTDGRHVWGNAFFANRGGGSFEEVSDRIGAENYWPWGLSVGDINADGYQDAFLTSCMNYPFRYAVNSLLLNDRGKRFIDSEFLLGVEPRRGGRTATPWFELDRTTPDGTKHQISEKLAEQGNRLKSVVVWGALGSRSSVIFDLDEDGDLDILTNDFNSEPMVLISDLTQRKKNLSYLKIRLVGGASNRDGLGARVTVKAGDLTQVRVHDGQSGYLSQSLLPLYFGLGEQSAVESIQVRWPSGKIQSVPNPESVNRTIEVREPQDP